MSTHRTRASAAANDVNLTPQVLAVWLSAFRDCFTAPAWNHVLVLVAGAVLAPGKRTVSQALRVMGLAAKPGFARYHEVLSRARWDGRAVAHKLLAQVLNAFLPAGEVVIGIDDTIERRWGAKIKARGIYRDPVRSSHGHFVKASGLRWLSLMVMVPIPWVGRRWALPFLTVLAPSERWSSEHGRRHKRLTDWTRQAIRQVKRWLPDRRLIIVADASFAALDMIAAIRRQVCLITRLRIDANLFAPAPPRRPGQMGRPRLKGRRLPKLAAVLAIPKTVWSPINVTEWYGGRQRKLEIVSGAAVWYHSGLPPAPIRWVLVRDPSGEREPQAFLSTDLTAKPEQILGWFVSRWRMEDVSGSADPSRRGDAAAVVRSRNPADDTGTARVVLLGDGLGESHGPLSCRCGPPANRRMVRQARPDLQRCHRRRSTRSLVSARFMHVSADQGDHRNPCNPAAKTH